MAYIILLLQMISNEEGIIAILQEASNVALLQRLLIDPYVNWEHKMLVIGDL